MSENQILELERGQLAHSRLVDAPLSPLADGEVRFRIQRLALTANTVTYGVTGDLLGYWDFYPSPLPWGRVPAMGWAELVESRHPDIATGGRYYGWFPMARYVDIKAAPSAEGLRDEGEHRRQHAPIYRSFSVAERDPLYQAGGEAEDRHALLRGLMQTAFLADDFLAEQEHFGGERILILSASSKTAIALAELSHARSGLQTIGLTSERNRAFVESLDCYHQVFSYAQIESLPAQPASVIVDMAGNTSLLDQLHRHLGPALKHSMAIGRSHHDAQRVKIGGSIQPSFFFAPLQGKKRIAEWGAKAYMDRLSQALFDCVARSQHWLQLEQHRGGPACEQAWQQTLQGQIGPERGLILSLWPD